VKISRCEVRALGEPLCGINTTASVPVLQTGNAGSTPACRSRRRELYGCSTGLLIQGNGVRAPGGAPCGRDGNWDTWSAQTRPCESSNLSARTVSGWGVGVPSKALTLALAGSSPAPEAFAAAHGCGPALVRRAVRIGTGRRLRCPRSPIGRRHEPEVLGSVRSNRTEDTMPS
jgi:hypothetical protein